MADGKESLVIEKKDDSKEDFIDAVGLATYSTSEPTVSSYVSIFENLWIQAELYGQLNDTNQQLALANEQLKIHDKMQVEFINVASHEMKTPTQSILGYSQLLDKHPEKREEIIHGILRNAIRLQKLTNDILEVARIESQTLKLNIEKFNLNDLILRIVEDNYTNQLENVEDSNRVKISFDYKLIRFKKNNNIIAVQGDKERIAQVFSNLLSNAIKFTAKEEERNISIDIKVQHEANNNNNNQVIVSIRDTGLGISPEILPRLFTKFVTTSFEGTGLGLFISKSIVEAHGGRIWAENNADGRGARFYFSLPLSNENQQNQQQENKPTLR